MQICCLSQHQCYDRQYSKDAIFTYGAEGCKLRLKLTTRVKLLDFLLDGRLLTIANVRINDILGRAPDCKDEENCFESIARHMGRGLKILLTDARHRTFPPERVSYWWPYCKFCPPKGYNCMISLCYDFLDFFSDFECLQKTVCIILNKLEEKDKQREKILSVMQKDIINIIGGLRAFEAWAEKNIKKPLFEGILERKYEGKFVQEWILDELNKNLKTWERLGLWGWPVIITGRHRKEQIEDQRGVLLSIINSNYKLHKEIRDKFLFIQNIEKESSLQEFTDSEAKFIDPLSTTFVTKFLIFCADSELTKDHFSDLEKIILNCTETVLRLFEEPVNRNADRLEFDYGQHKIVVFDGTGFPMLDGAWMNFELIPDPSFPPPLPDYSLCSTLDIAGTLALFSALYTKFDTRTEKMLENIKEKLVNYIIERRLAQTRTAREAINRLDISHWHDRYCTFCDFSDIYGTTKMLEYLLNVVLSDIIKGNYKHASSLLFETPSFRQNLFWIVSQQREDGYWPIVSNTLLELAFENDSLRYVLSSYFEDLGLPREMRREYNLKDIITQNKEKIISYANTIEVLALLSKYFFTRILLGAMH